ncbi:BnaA02g22900D [Brassica napus]|uniref:BnaA02g22900D protein n=1 Tax=Brassica napus TaxID=3708 RepID=A0A078FRK7_BRANA|nr:BnaA02g22900D [Brassica napus]
MGNITQNSSITNVSPLPRRPCRMLRINFKDGLTHQARAARKEILNNKRTIGLTTSNRGPYNSTQSSPTLANLSVSGINMHPSSTIGYQETISRSTLRKRKTIGSPPSVNSKTRHKEARQGPNMTRQTNPTGPAVSVEDAPREATQSPFQQTKTNEFIPPPRFIVEDHPEAYNNRYAMEIQLLPLLSLGYQKNGDDLNITTMFLTNK